MKAASIFKKEFESKTYDDVLVKLYKDERVLEYQRTRYMKAFKAFISTFEDQDVALFSSPGRTEIGGNHTDHQGGKVLAAAINLDGIGIASKKKDVITIKSDDYPLIEVNIADLDMVESEKGSSAGIVRGMCQGFKQHGYEIGGFDLYMTSDVFSGSGLSSSAMFEAMIGTILNAFYNDNRMDSIEKAQISQYAENVYFGKPCGLMDQMAICVGNFVYIDFKDKLKPVVSKIDYDFASSHYALCIVDTKSSHDDLTDEYAAIPSEMKKIASYYHKEVLSQVNEDDFYHDVSKLRTACGDRAVLRAMHYFSECHVVDEEKEALEHKDVKSFLMGVTKSGNSSFKYLQNIYASKAPDTQGVSFALALSEHIMKDQGVARVHGGGFAGTIEVFVEEAILPTFITEMNRNLGEGSVHVLKIREQGACQVL